MKYLPLILLTGAALCVAIAVLVVPRSVFLSSLTEHTIPGLVPASAWARNLDSKDTDLVRESLGFLARRKNPAGVSRAVELLTHPDDYIWLNAAHYAGVCNRQEAVPYLVKALRHTAWRADADTAKYLRGVTGEDFGTDFVQWQKWWLAGHPDSTINWESHLGHAPRLMGKRTLP